MTTKSGETFKDCLVIATYPADAPFIVFGHYWFPWGGAGAEYTPPHPELLGPGRNVACVDYSVGKGGRLVSLRYPEREFVSVACKDLEAPPK